MSRRLECKYCGNVQKEENTFVKGKVHDSGTAVSIRGPEVLPCTECGKTCWANKQ